MNLSKSPDRDEVRRRRPTAEIEWQEEPTAAEPFVASIDELMNEDPDGVFRSVR